MKKIVLFAVSLMFFASCGSEDTQEKLEELTEVPEFNDVVLSFNNTFKDKTIILGQKGDENITVNVSKAGQTHQFSELKYIISNIRLVSDKDEEIAYHVDDLDEGATIINHSKKEACRYRLKDIVSGSYKKVKFGLGVKTELNILDQEKFPNFYAKADAYEAKMMWYWGKGYRFLKIEGIYSKYDQELSIHTGSTLVDGVTEDDPAYIQGVDAYQEIILELPENIIVGEKAPVINIKADFDKLLSGGAHEITLVSGQGQSSNATPNTHTSDQMVKFLDNLGYEQKGIFSIESIEN